jgi:phage gp29-like protein
MAREPQLLDRWGTPVRRTDLRREVAGATLGGVRSPLTGYPADGLNPQRLATILREADAGDPIRYLELAEIIEERDPHYTGVLGTRKRSVSQIDIAVEEGGDDARSAEMAEMVRDWLRRDELAEELFNILDALGKGYSHTEIIWETSTLQWMPARLEWRDPRWFRFARHDLATPVMLDQGGNEVTYPAYQFIFATMAAKSGLPLRSGLARLATWSWMFKAYTQRDWAIFTQTYGQPIRVGKYGPGASEEDRETLFRAVANIGGDCAAIIPESMLVEFVESANVGASSDHYERRADWLDKQISKAVLGQTSTTDAQVGGLGSGKEHREVQKDIETADCRALAAILNRDLIRPWIDLEYGPQQTYPRLRIERPEPEDLAALSSALAPLIDRGLRVSARSVLEKFGLAEPEAGAEILRPAMKSDPQMPPGTAPADATGPQSAIQYLFNGHIAPPRPEAALQAKGPSAARSAPPDPADLLAERLEIEARPAMAMMLGQIEAMMNAAGSLEEFREMLLAGFGEIDATGLAQVMGAAMVAAHLGGRVVVEDEAGD